MRTLRLLLVCVSLLLVASIFAQERTHTVKKGDTLWDIAGYYYQDPFLWPHIWQANREAVADPHWIYPWQTFVIPPVPAKPLPEVPGVAVPPEVPPEAPPEVPEVPPIELVERLKPVVSKELAFKGGYISREDVVGGYILRSEPPDIENLITNHTVYINRGGLYGVNVGDNFAIFRMGRKVKHPKTGRYLGRIVRILGTLRVTKSAEDVSTAIITRSFEPIHPKDRLMPYQEVEVPTGVSLEPAGIPLEGYLVTRLNGIGVVKPFDVVLIDKGQLEGVGPGDVFEIYRTGKRTRDPETGRGIQLPDVKVGGIQVLASKDETSTAYITAIDGKLDLKPGETIRLTHRISAPLKRELGEIEEEPKELMEEELMEEEPVIEELPAIEEPEMIEEQEFIQEGEVIEEEEPMEEEAVEEEEE